MAAIYISLLLAALAGNTYAFKQTGTAKPLVKPYDQRFLDRYSVLKYTGNFGPYSSRSGNGISTDIPAGCEVDQVVLLHRHGERYPDIPNVEAQQAVLKKIYGSLKEGERFSGDLEFLNNWNYFLENEGDVALEIENSPYSGIADLLEHGAEFRGRYGHLWDGESKVPIFASGSERVVQSARAFGNGFFGYNYTDIAEVNIISEKKNVGANAISPTFCDSNQTTECAIPNPNGRLLYPEYDVATLRLNREHGLSLNASEVIQLFDIACFDTSVHGDSPWLQVFTRDEWLAYSYMMGIEFYCYYGGGSAIGRAAGTNWANATTTVLNQGPDDSGLPLVLNFCHDSDITSFLGGMNILSPLKPLNPGQVTFDTRWDIADIVPMGANLIIERLQCQAPGLTNQTNLINTNSSLPDSAFNGTNVGSAANESTSYFLPNSTTISSSNSSTPSTFVRLLLNDAVLPLDNCYGGPGYSCSLEDWTELVKEQTELNNFIETCKPEQNSVPSYIDYYWNYNHTTDQNAAKYIPWQGSALQ